ncbi:hypothetical protein DAPK24_050130 [Pichia kluyveri]|uniref:BZIP domain-containing protein n=1 Tax=Pichia kluyveri TaxID=36015 RepID=A0AAV5RA72_PICKL|nr:hypothetical protein DAPK24_050130 [Pichia kluyveri]
MLSVAPKSNVLLNPRMKTITPIQSDINDKPIKKIVMSKEWVLPPRPKPGRKPCEDIPSSKRKAQNRAAQRAFRERRANRVSELEEKIMGIERERSINDGILKDKIKNLQRENEILMMENKRIKSENARLLTQMNNSKNNENDKKQNSITFDSLFNLVPQAAVPLRKRKSSEKSVSPTDEIDFTNSFTVKKQRKMPILNDVFKSNSNNNSNLSISSMNSFSKKNESMITLNSLSNLSHNNSSSSIDSANINNINNTNTTITNTTTINNNHNNNIPFESCGFCSDDTPCVCREIETEHQLLQQREIRKIQENKKADKEREQEENEKKQERKKSLMDLEIEKKEKELIMELTKNIKNEDLSQIIECNGDPGTCLQCKSDPLSTQFCKTIAEKSNNINKGTIKDISTIQLPSIDKNSILNRNSLPSLTSLKLDEPGKTFIPCADAYKTISNHLSIRNVGINNITNNLQTRGMFVEVGSVVSCLRELDRNFTNSK